jgi:hypothetical protein
METTDTSALVEAMGGAGEEGNSLGGGITFLFDDNGGSSRVSESFLLKQEASRAVTHSDLRHHLA